MILKTLLIIIKDYAIVLHEMARSFWHYSKYERNTGALKMCKYGQCDPYAKPAKKLLKMPILYCVLYTWLD